MAAFASTTNPTSYGYFDSDPVFQSEADAFQQYVRFHFASPVLSVELSDRMIWRELEWAVLKWGQIVAEFEMEGDLFQVLGANRLRIEEAGGLNNNTLTQSLNWATHLMEGYAIEAGLRGPYESYKGFIQLQPQKQDYDLRTDLLRFDTHEPAINGLPKGTKLRILDIMHIDPVYAPWQIGSGAYYNQFMQAFSRGAGLPGYGSFGYNGQFSYYQVTPFYDDVLRGNWQRTAFKIRRSGYTYRIMGQRIRFSPIPLGQMPVYFELADGIDPASELENLLDASGNVDDSNDTIKGYVNVPYKVPTFYKINSAGRQWIRDFALARCKVVLGNARGKYSSIPYLDKELTLNFSELWGQGTKEMEDLETKLRERLTALTPLEILKKKAEEAEALEKINSKIPIPPEVVFKLG